jgi:hypothetical protein
MPARPSLDASVRAQGGVGSGGCTLGNGTAVYQHAGCIVDAEPAEGDPPNSTVVLRFADAAAAWGLLNDPECRPVKEIRFSITSRGQAVVAPEFTPVG